MIVFCLIVITISLLYVYIHMTEKSRKIDKMFPGPFRTPILGTLLLDAMQKQSKYRTGLAQIYNNRPYRLWFVNKPYIMVSDYKSAKIILSDSKFMDKADAYKAFAPLVGVNHFLGSGEIYAKYRKHLNYAFNPQAYHHYLKVFNKNSDKLCQVIKKKIVRKEDYNVQKDIGMFIMDNLTETFTGEVWNWLDNANPQLVKAMEDITRIFRWRLIVPILSFDWVFNLTPMSRTQKKAIQIGREYCRKLVETKREKIERQKMSNGDDNKVENEESEFQDTLTRGILSKKFTDEEIEIEIASVIFAGFESASTTICFALYELAKQQEIQEKVYEEVKAIMEESENWADMNDLNKMVYTEQVVYETLRYYTPFTAIGRHVKEDLYINDQQYIPKDTNVFISLSGIHKDPNNWPNPRVFDPERFTPENIEKRDPYAFVAFSGGPRKCAGYKYALMEIKIALAKIVQQFKVSLSSKPEHEVKPVRNMGLTLASRTGFHFQLEPRYERDVL